MEREHDGASPLRSGVFVRRSACVVWALALVGQSWLVMHDLLGVGSSRLDTATTDLVQNNLFLLAALLCAVRAWSCSKRSVPNRRRAI